MAGTANVTPDMLNHSKKFWYLALISKATKEPLAAWLEPSRIYLYPESLQACTNDLVAPFKPEEIDLVAGIDGTGFILGTAVACKLGKGFFMLRKGGHLSVEADTESYYDYKKFEKKMEMRTNLFPKGSRVLIVDQWIETGGTMNTAIKLIERQGGIVAGIATLCAEPSEGTQKLLATHKVSHTNPPEVMQELKDHSPEFFVKLVEIMKK